jgi:hypothetical protein
MKRGEHMSVKPDDKDVLWKYYACCKQLDDVKREFANYKEKNSDKINTLCYQCDIKRYNAEINSLTKLLEVELLMANITLRSQNRVLEAQRDVYKSRYEEFIKRYIRMVESSPL